jgi:hypothetical protein
MGALLLLGGGGGWAFWKASAAPAHLRARLSFWELVKHKKVADWEPSLTPEQRRAKARDITARLMVEYPILAAEERPVPAEENGFLLMLRKNAGLGLTSELRDFLSKRLDDEVLDVELARRLLLENATVVAEVEHIAALQARSSADPPADYVGFVSARSGIDAIHVLLLAARLAAVANDSEGAIAKVALAVNLIRHYRDIETPNFQCETVVIVGQMEVCRVVLDRVLPALGKTADLEKWRRVLGSADLSPARLAGVVRGDWQIASQYFLLPLVLDPADPVSPPDPEALADALAARAAEIVARIQNQSFQDTLSLENRAASTAPGSLSAKSQSLFEVSGIGTQTWAEGVARSATVLARTDAALQLLELEKKAELDAAALARLPVDPVSGMPFSFDPQARTLSAPMNPSIEPLRLPW